MDTDSIKLTWIDIELVKKKKSSPQNRQYIIPTVLLLLIFVTKLSVMVRCFMNSGTFICTYRVYLIYYVCVQCVIKQLLTFIFVRLPSIYLHFRHCTALTAVKLFPWQE